MDSTPSKVYDEDSIQIDEAEEEALLKSDDELDAGKANVSLDILRPPSTVELVDDNSLLNEPYEMENGTILNAETGDDSLGAVGMIGDDEDNDHQDSDDEEEAEEIKSLTEFLSISKELESNQYAYDKYMRLCELSHATGDLENIRKAYSSFANVYPLTPDLWQKYINVELILAQSNAEINNVKELFQRALKDYYSCDLAKEYAIFAQRCDDSDKIWQEVLGTYGLNCCRGREFYILFRQQFTSGKLDLMETINRNKYIESFLTELRYPLQEMEQTHIEFKVYCEKNKDTLADMQLDWTQIDARYFKAKDHLKKIINFEDKLKALEDTAFREKAEVYLAYIKDADKYLDENVLQTIYERMVADCCLNAECWISYIDFIEYRDEYGRPKDLLPLPLFEQTPDYICQRALRNCTWSKELYIKRMHILEKMDAPKTAVQEILECAAAAGFQTPEPAVAVWLEYLTYLRRNTDWSDMDQCDVLRKNFNLAWTVLGQQWGVLADCNCEILQFWGRLEYGPLQDPRRGKELWNTVMESADNSCKSGLWMEFVLLESQRDPEATRKLFSKALNTPGIDNPSVIASAWERFERCNGSVKALVNCIKECCRFKLHFTETSYSKTQKTAAKSSKRKLPQIGLNESPSKQSKIEHEKPRATTTNTSKDKESAFKEHESQEIDLSKDHLRIFLSNLDYNLSENQIRSGLAELSIVTLELIRSPNGRSRGFGYAELATTDEVEKAIKLDRKDLNGRPVYISSVLRDKEQRQKFKYSAGVEPTKLFIKGLPQDTTKAELEDKFKKFGPLKDVRLVYHKSGKFKQIAYVEYEDESSASKAVLSLDNADVRGHSISVAISAPPPKPAAISGAVNQITLSNLSTKRNRNQLEQKPRLSLLPMAVRKNLTATNNVAVQNTLPVSTSPSTGSTSKSNEDFRKLLNK